jgi:hypothetical protein
VYLGSTATGSLEVGELSAACGTSDDGTIYLRCNEYSSGTTTIVHSVNSMANNASQGDHGSGLAVEYQYRLSLRFCILSRNDRACCLYLAWNIQGGSISCVTLSGNTCTQIRIDPV